MGSPNTPDPKTSQRLTEDGAKRIAAAHERYVFALGELNRIRCAKCESEPDYPTRVAEARRRMEGALGEWVTVYERETGRCLSIGANRVSDQGTGALRCRTPSTAHHVAARAGRA